MTEGPPVLVATVKTPDDLRIAREEGWYRVPVRKAPKALLSAHYIAFYQPASFGEDGRRIRHYARIRGISVCERRKLIPDEDHPKAREPYYRVEIGKLLELPRPIYNARGMRVVFLRTTLDRLFSAGEIGEL